jgi:hypothetical protein
MGGYLERVEAMKEESLLLEGILGKLVLLFKQY